jgi:hypothetical protein
MPPLAAYRRSSDVASVDTGWLPSGRVLVLLLLLPAVAWSQTICPYRQSLCSVSADNYTIFQMQCDNYGSVGQLPASCSDTRIINALKIGNSGTIVTSLQARILSGLQVQRLDLSGLGIRTIDLNAFAAVGSNITELYLNDNQIATIADNTFISLTRVTIIQLRNNKLTFLGYQSLYGLFAALSMDFSGNQLSSLSPTTFDGKSILPYTSFFYSGTSTT